MRSLHIFVGIREEYGNVGLVFLVEVQRLGASIASDGIAHSSHDNLPDGLLIVEFYLCLYRMYVDINALRLYRKVQEIGNLLSFGNEPVIG